MAVSAGLGFDVNFSQLKTEIQQADKALASLVNNYQRLANSIGKKSASGSQKGLLGYINQMKELEKLLKTLGDKKLNIGVDTTNVKVMKDALSDLIKYTDAISKGSKGALNYSKSAKSLNDMRTAIKMLDEARKKENLSTKTGLKNYQKLTAELMRQKAQYASFTNEVKKSSNITSGLGNRLGLLFSVSSIKGYIDQLIRVRGEFELQQRSLEVLLQNKDDADKLWDKTVQLAVKSPFTVRQLVTYTKQLAAYRIESEKLYETNKMLADISAGLGVDMNRLILAYGQVKAANYLRGTELRQFSEAGVNVLGELADRFTELEGRSVSVGEVFERVSKRMVSFADVDAVLKKLTSQGGIFYQMQEFQAETLRGQIMNLRDSIDLMLNDIGKANEGILKDSVAVVRSLVQNWEAVATALKIVVAGFAVYKVNLLLADEALLNFAIRHNLAIKGATNLRVALNLAGQAAKKFGIALASAAKANAWLLAIGALVSVVWELVESHNEYSKALEEIDDKFTETAGKVKELGRAYDELIEQEKNLTEEQKNDKKVTDKIYDDKKKKLKELADYAKSQNITLSIDVSSPTPQNIDDTVKQIQEDIYVAAERNKAYGEALAESLTEFEGVWGFNFAGDNIKTDAQQLERAMRGLTTADREIDKALNEISAKWEEMPTSVRNYYNEIKAGAKEGETEQEFLERRVKLIASANQVLQQYYRTELSNSDKLEDLEYSRNKIIRRRNELQTEYQKIVKRVLEELGEEDLSQLTEEQKITFLAEIDKESAKISSNEVIQELIHDWANTDFVINVKPQVDPTDSAVEAWRLAFDKEFEGTKINPIVDSSIGKEQLKDFYKSLADENKKLAKDLQNEVGSVMYKSVFNAPKGVWEPIRKTNEEIKAEIAEAKKLEKLYNDAYKFLGGDDKTSGTKDHQKKRLNEQISLVKKLLQEYEKLRKTKGAAEAIDILKAEGGEFADAFEMLNISDLLENLTPENILDENGVFDINKWAKYAMKAFGSGLKQADLKTILAKSTAGFEVEIGIKADEKKIDEFNDSVAELFERLNLTKELDKLGISPDIAKLFGFETIDLSDLRKRIEEESAKMANASGELGDDEVKAKKRALDQIDAMERKSIEERMKNYIKYLTESMSERVQIELNAQRDINKIRKDETLDDFSKEQAVNQREQKMADDLAQYDFDQLKGSDVYIEVFKDLENASREQLQYVIDKLKELQDVNKGLSPTQVKAMAKELKNAQEAMGKRSSFLDIGKNMVEAAKFAIQRNRLLKEQVALQEQIGTKTKERNAEEKKLFDMTLERDSLQPYTSEWNKANAEVEEQQKKVIKLNDELEKLSKDQDDVSNKISNGTQAWNNFRGAISKAREGLAEAKESVDAVFEGLDSMGLMTDGMRDGFESFTEIIGGVDTILAGLGQIDVTKPFSIITGGLKAIGGVFKTIGGFFGIGDKKREREIQKEVKLVDKLQKEYENLEQAIEDAYSMDTYKASFDAAKGNLDEQIASTERMIALEEDKKKTDSDKLDEYKEQLEELKEQQKELNEQAFSEMTSGILDDVKSAARGFVDAWYDAFKETGDGLSGLEDNFKEMFLNLAKEQAALQIVGAFAEGWKNDLKKYIDPESGDLELTKGEANAWAKEVRSDLDAVSAALEGFFTGIQEGIGDTTNAANLSELQKGIQGITEDTAQVLESLLSSIRLYVATSTEYARDQLTYTKKIFTLFDNMTAAHPSGSRGLKVVI